MRVQAEGIAKALNLRAGDWLCLDDGSLVLVDSRWEPGLDGQRIQVEGTVSVLLPTEEGGIAAQDFYRESDVVLLLDCKRVSK